MRLTSAPLGVLSCAWIAASSSFIWFLVWLLPQAAYVTSSWHREGGGRMGLGWDRGGEGGGLGSDL